jgi:hypothetical protein
MIARVATMPGKVSLILVMASVVNDYTAVLTGSRHELQRLRFIAVESARKQPVLGLCSKRGADLPDSLAWAFLRLTTVLDGWKRRPVGCRCRVVRTSLCVFVFSDDATVNDSRFPQSRFLFDHRSVQKMLYQRARMCSHPLKVSGGMFSATGLL